mmetsp:Transcript_18361/g.54781  ORF Transcript_18361/g.54781 Transcript_18361/m.54781 type:complete len:341 (+) Transcript_18361:1459-2481(+)
MGWRCRCRVREKDQDTPVACLLQQDELDPSFEPTKTKATGRPGRLLRHPRHCGHRHHGYRATSPGGCGAQAPGAVRNVVDGYSSASSAPPAPPSSSSSSSSSSSLRFMPSAARESVSQPAGTARYAGAAAALNCSVLLTSRPTFHSAPVAFSYVVGLPVRLAATRMAGPTLPSSPSCSFASSRNVRWCSAPHALHTATSAKLGGGGGSSPLGLGFSAAPFLSLLPAAAFFFPPPAAATKRDATCSSTGTAPQPTAARATVSSEHTSHRMPVRYAARGAAAVRHASTSLGSAPHAFMASTKPGQAARKRSTDAADVATVSFMPPASSPPALPFPFAFPAAC